VGARGVLSSGTRPLQLLIAWWWCGRTTASGALWPCKQDAFLGLGKAAHRAGGQDVRNREPHPVVTLQVPELVREDRLHATGSSMRCTASPRAAARRSVQRLALRSSLFVKRRGSLEESQAR
jgi:hypothetical protein